MKLHNFIIIIIIPLFFAKNTFAGDSEERGPAHAIMSGADVPFWIDAPHSFRAGYMYFVRWDVGLYAHLGLRFDNGGIDANRLKQYSINTGMRYYVDIDPRISLIPGGEFTVKRDRIENYNERSVAIFLGMEYFMTETISLGWTAAFAEFALRQNTITTRIGIIGGGRSYFTLHFYF